LLARRLWVRSRQPGDALHLDVGIFVRAAVSICLYEQFHKPMNTFDKIGPRIPREGHFGAAFSPHNS